MLLRYECVHYKPWNQERDLQALKGGVLSPKMTGMTMSVKILENGSIYVVSHVGKMIEPWANFPQYMDNIFNPIQHEQNYSLFCMFRVFKDLKVSSATYLQEGNWQICQSGVFKDPDLVE